MQETIWDDKESTQSTSEQTPLTSSPIKHIAQDCLIYGHDWQTTEILGVKQCSACGITGYCPGCTRNPKSGTLPFYCTTHTRIESTPVQ